jgi:hypothetical protein
VYCITLVNGYIIVYDDFYHRIGCGKMAAKSKDWQAQVKGILKAELKRRDVSYADLAGKLGAIGVKDNERNIANKIARGSFTAVFFVQCLEAIGCQTVHLNGL